MKSNVNITQGLAGSGVQRAASFATLPVNLINHSFMTKLAYTPTAAG